MEFNIVLKKFFEKKRALTKGCSDGIKIWVFASLLPSLFFFSLLYLLSEKLVLMLQSWYPCFIVGTEAERNRVRKEQGAVI